ncbi:Hsp20/alpha crystallin family protein [Solitalea sp. MAHUQ-68]|uniref:Hsp20/alpha crystallin family protein n=1 Tax=Solitalea agri TaxID=2953739 RepID=A0A9X2F491_9SPHI|nr:Hsp20/alpha crystallin family protein [Solitalea agri]MCO4294509.1 Hsp20/alpha crystallin family protein [Solitalea agri]
MTLIKRNYPVRNFERVNPFAPMFNDLFETMFNGTSLSEGNFKVPAVNVLENAEEFSIELAAPGLSKDDFKIDLEKNTLTISVQKEEEHKEETKNYHRKEFSYSSFKRSFNLPETVDVEKIGAEYKDGVLSVGIPKKAEAQLKAKQIKVS